MRIFVNIFANIIVAWLYSMAALAASITEAPSIAFYYAQHIPVDELSQFEQIVVDPDHISDKEIIKLKQYGGKVIAYVSVGESERWRQDYSQIDKKLFTGVNKSWGSDIVDLTQPQWQHFLLQQRFSKLAKRHFDGFFLDTLDSYQRFLAKDKWPAQEQALIKIIRTLAKHFPDSKILLNRGFAVLQDVHPLVHGVVAESLYAGWDPLKKQYREVNKPATKWLLNKLSRVKEKYRLPVTVIDYLPPSQRQQARSIAQKIAQHGFVPWVSTPRLDYLGMGKQEVLPRKVLMLYNSSNQYLGDIASSSTHTAAAMPIEYLGYVPEYYDIKNHLPDGVLKGRYAGIVAWFDGQAKNPAYRDWLYKQIKEGIKVVFMGEFAFDIDDELLSLLGLRRVERPISKGIKILSYDDYLGFESKPLISKSYTDIFQSVSGSSNTPHMRVSLGDTKQHIFEPVITAEWGGIAFSPWIRDQQINGFKYWILNPFKFFKTALGLTGTPMPDVTTENGRRLWMAHIDGDGFLNRAEMPGTPYAATVIKNKILKKYLNYPHTVSIIEGEIAKTGLYPEQSADLEKIARKIFSLPNVEAATHTFSHPFKWLDIKENQNSGDGYNLPIKNYRFSFKREILGSIDYINKNLLPDNKKARIVLWTGESLPVEIALKYSFDNNLLNFNGGNTTIRKDRASILFISPMVRTVGPYTQIYAPIENENVYTNNWTGPYYGFQRVIDTFRMTNQPRRIKPIDIYYHFYSGSKPAALTALTNSYNWSIQQEIFPVYISEYVTKVREFRNIVVARDLQGRLYYSGMQHLKTLRSFSKRHWPSIQNSLNVAGYRKLHDATYISLAAGKITRLNMSPLQKPEIYLLQSNGRINQWQQRGKDIFISLSSALPLMIEIAAQHKQCRLFGAKHTVRQTSMGWRFKLAAKKISNARIHCQ